MFEFTAFEFRIKGLSFSLVCWRNSCLHLALGAGCRGLRSGVVQG